MRVDADVVEGLVAVHHGAESPVVAGRPRNPLARHLERHGIHGPELEESISVAATIQIARNLMASIDAAVDDPEASDLMVKRQACHPLEVGVLETLEERSLRPREEVVEDIL